MNPPGLSLLTARGELAITPAGLATWASRLCSWDGTAKPQSADRNWLGDSFPEMFFLDDVAILEVQGTLMLRPSFIERNLGAIIGYETISGWLDSAVAKNVKGILLFVASPGGNVTGMIETAERIAEVATKIPVAVWCDDLDASAAFALSAGAGKIFCSKSCMMGSIGTRVTILDASAFYASIGLKFHSFASGAYKAAGDETQPMTADWAQYFSGLVSTSADAFKNFVSAYRDISPDLMDGRIMRGSEAVTNGFADEICPSLEAAVQKLIDGEVPLQKKKPGTSSFSRAAGPTGSRSHSSAKSVDRDIAEAELAYDRAVASGRAQPITARTSQRYTLADFKNGKLND